MELDALTTIICNMGFPIACCCYLFYSNDKMRNTLEQNTKAIESLKDVILSMKGEK